MNKFLLLLIGIIPVSLIGMDKELQPPAYATCIHGDTPFYQPHINGIMDACNIYLPQQDSREADEVTAKLADALATRANPYNAILHTQFEQPTRSLDRCRPEYRPCIKGILCIACSIPVVMYDAVTGSCPEDESLDDENPQSVDAQACCPSTQRLMQVMQE